MRAAFKIISVLDLNITATTITFDQHEELIQKVLLFLYCLQMRR